jgi:hypothetical protein
VKGGGNDVNAMATPSGAGGPADLSVQECWQILLQHRVGRVVLTDRGLPTVAPVGYVRVQDAVVFRTGGGSRLARLLPDTVVAFAVDDVASGRTAVVSVVLTGMAQRLDPTVDGGDLDGFGRARDALEGDYFRVVPGLLSGQRFRL